MGLDVIGNTTFGALSESELAFALSSALPTKLPPQALRKWLIEKRKVQQKFADYLQHVAIFLGTPGNTIAGWLDIQRSFQTTQDKNKEDEGLSDEQQSRLEALRNKQGNR